MVEWRWAVAVTLPVMVGCGGDDGGQRGELGNGTFYYSCNDKADAQCDEDAVVGDLDPTTSAFPPIAEGARFSVRFEHDDDDPSRLEYIRFAGDYVQGTQGDTVFTAAKAGVSAMIATDGSAEAYDLVHVTVVEPVEVRVSETTTAAERVEDIAAGANLAVGDDVAIDVSAEVTLATRTFFRAAPVDGAGRLLAGGLDTEWVSSDPAVVEIVSDPNNNVIEIEPRGAGTATLTVTMGTLTQPVMVEATP